MTPPIAPTIAVVIAVRNLEEFVAATLRSVLGQSEARFELIVIVDSSSDRTAAIAREFAVDPRLSVHEVAAGSVSCARNLGLELVTAPIVLFLDGDDCLDRHALGHFIEAMAAHPGAVAAVGGHDKIDEAGALIPGETVHDRPAFDDSDSLVTLLARNTIVNGGAIAIRTEEARAAGGFDVELRHGEDWEFWVRLAHRGPFASLGPCSVLQYRQRRTSAFARRGVTQFRTDAIDKAFALARAEGQVPAATLQRLQRNALISNYWATARAVFYAGELSRFGTLTMRGLLRYPDSLWRGFLLRFVWRMLRQQVVRRS